MVFGKLGGILLRGAPVLIGPTLLLIAEPESEMVIGWLFLCLGSVHMGIAGLLASVVFFRVPIAIAATYVGGIFQAAYGAVFFLFVDFILAAGIQWIIPGVDFDDVVFSPFLLLPVSLFGFTMIASFNLYLSTSLFEPMTRLDR